MPRGSVPQSPLGPQRARVGERPARLAYPGGAVIAGAGEVADELPSADAAVPVHGIHLAGGVGAHALTRPDDRLARLDAQPHVAPLSRPGVHLDVVPPHELSLNRPRAEGKARRAACGLRVPRQAVMVPPSNTQVSRPPEAVVSDTG